MNVINYRYDLLINKHSGLNEFTSYSRVNRFPEFRSHPCQFPWFQYKSKQ